MRDGFNIDELQSLFWDPGWIALVYTILERLKPEEIESLPIGQLAEAIKKIKEEEGFPIERQRISTEIRAGEATLDFVVNSLIDAAVEFASAKGHTKKKSYWEGMATCKRCGTAVANGYFELTGSERRALREGKYAPEIEQRDLRLTRDNIIYSPLDEIFNSNGSLLCNCGSNDLTVERGALVYVVRRKMSPDALGKQVKDIITRIAAQDIRLETIELGELTHKRQHYHIVRNPEARYRIVEDLIFRAFAEQGFSVEPEKKNYRQLYRLFDRVTRYHINMDHMLYGDRNWSEVRPILKQMIMELIEPPIAETRIRIKDFGRLLTKLEESKRQTGLERDKKTPSDLYGARIILPSALNGNGVEVRCTRMVEYIEYTFHVIDRKDYIHSPREGYDGPYHDWLGPKENGYRSIHRKVSLIAGGIPVEVQLRTPKMAYFAENEVAHSAYVDRKKEIINTYLFPYERKVIETVVAIETGKL